MKKIVRSAAALAAVAVSSSALADSPALEPLIVTATRTPAAPAEVLASVEVIPGEELARLPGGDLADALRFRAGMELARTGGPGQQTSLFLRGTDSNHVLVLVDGVRINPGTIGVAALQNIPPSMIERVEIVKGPRSALYGSDAIGGVINVITRRDAGLSLEVGGGSYDTRTAALSAGTGDADGGASIGVNWLDSAGFPTRSSDDVDRGYRNLSANASVRRQVGGVALAARAWYASGTSEYSDFFVTPVDQDFENAAFALEAAGSPRAGWDTRVTLGHALDRIEQNQSPDFLKTRRWQLDWQNDVAIGERHALTAGVLLQQEKTSSESFGLGFDQDTGMQLAYLQDQFTAGRHRLLAAVGYTNHEDFGGETTWNLEYGFALTPSTSASLAAGTAFRAPDATDRYGFGGNPDLAPESSESFEVALRHRVGERHLLTLAAFRNDIDDLIQYVVTDFNTFDGENRNVARARIEGVEASWRYEGERWFSRASATWQDPRDLGTNERLLRRARENFTLALGRRVGPHAVAVDFLAAGDRLDFGFPAPVELPSYVVASLSARLALPGGWRLTARVENLFDEQYELASGYNTPDRSAYLTLGLDVR
jgi:vitamin B12 transporter